MSRQIFSLFLASILGLAALPVLSLADSAPAGDQTCLAEAQKLELDVNQKPDGQQKTKILSRLHKAEKAAENDANSSDCKHYLQRAKAGLGIE